MAEDVDEILVAIEGTAFFAPVGTTAPTEAKDALTAPWIDFGVLSEEGASFNDNKDIADIFGWKGFYPKRKIVTGKATTISFGLRQWNTDNLKFVMGGGSFDGSGTYSPPDAEDQLQENALCLDWADGTEQYRLYIPRGSVSSTVTFNLVKNDNALLPVEFSVVGEEGVTPFKIFTDAVAMDSDTAS